MIPPGDTSHFIKLEVKTTTSPLWVSNSSKSTGKEGSYSAGWGDCYCLQGAIGLLLHNGRKEEYTGYPQGHLKVLPYPVIKINSNQVGLLMAQFLQE